MVNLVGFTNRHNVKQHFSLRFSFNSSYRTIAFKAKLAKGFQQIYQHTLKYPNLLMKKKSTNDVLVWED